MSKIIYKSSVLDNSREIDNIDSMREDYKLINENKQQVCLVTMDWRDLSWDDFPKGSKVIRLTIDKSLPPDDKTKDALYEQFLHILSDDCTTIGEFTKLSTPDGKLAYVWKGSANHDETVASITQAWDNEITTNQN